MIPGAGDEDVGDEDIALEVQEKFEQVGEKIELLGQKMFVGAGKLINQVKETTRDAIKETKEVIKETRDAFAVKDSGKTPKRGRDEFAIRVQAIQRDSGTYCDDPKNVKLFEHFSESFTMDVWFVYSHPEGNRSDYNNAFFSQEAGHPMASRHKS